jgi:hypothetical protein
MPSKKRKISVRVKVLSLSFLIIGTDICQVAVTAKNELFL